jgi:hypothetical protein
MIITGNLIIDQYNAGDYAELESVSGDLCVYSSCTLPALITVDRLEVRASCTLPALTKVGWLVVYADCTLPALAKVVGWLYVHAACTLSAPMFGHQLAHDGEYALWRESNGLYRAGCRRGLTAEQALRHWAREDKRAKLFTAAIKAAEGLE